MIVSEIVAKLIDLNPSRLHYIIDIANQRLGPQVIQKAPPKPKVEVNEWKDVSKKGDDVDVLKSKIKTLQEEKAEMSKQVSLFKGNYETARLQRERAEKDVNPTVSFLLSFFPSFLPSFPLSFI